ncbi:MAG: hypothetical protein RBS57_15710 [Desulforhabdus sp.]|jgi:hypothetical protein|nr:hypothetical protein [Desulforhabdus sp.]
MERLEKVWEGFVSLLAEYDSHKITETFRQLEWNEVLHYPLLWAVGISLLAYLVWRRRFQTLLLTFSLIAFIALLLNVLPTEGNPIPLSDIVFFISGSIALVVVNLYFFFVRG